MDVAGSDLQVGNSVGSDQDVAKNVHVEDLLDKLRILLLCEAEKRAICQKTVVQYQIVQPPKQLDSLIQDRANALLHVAEVVRDDLDPWATSFDSPVLDTEQTSFCAGYED